MTRGHIRVTFLGTGTSHGVPMIGCRCATCRSEDPRDRRWRPSILIELADETTVLVDTTPDLRTQALAFGVTRVDAVLFTHAHADHVFGLDETRRFNVLQQCALPCYGDARTIASIRRIFSYVFESAAPGGGVPKLALFTIEGPFCLGRATVVPVPIRHGDSLILGFRVGRFAYLTDCSGVPDASWELLQELDVVVVGALRNRPHPTHFTIDQAIEIVRRLSPRRAYFTHICHDLQHATTNARLPAGVELAYDGLVIEADAS